VFYLLHCHEFIQAFFVHRSKASQFPPASLPNSPKWHPLVEATLRPQNSPPRCKTGKPATKTRTPAKPSPPQNLTTKVATSPPPHRPVGIGKLSTPVYSYSSTPISPALTVHFRLTISKEYTPQTTHLSQVRSAEWQPPSSSVQSCYSYTR
jgi:hypothetical protein